MKLKNWIQRIALSLFLLFAATTLFAFTSDCTRDASGDSFLPPEKFESGQKANADAVNKNFDCVYQEVQELKAQLANLKEMKLESLSVNRIYTQKSGFVAGKVKVPYKDHAHKALLVMQKRKHERGTWYRGHLYGQVMLTRGDQGAFSRHLEYQISTVCTYQKCLFTSNGGLPVGDCSYDGVSYLCAKLPYANMSLQNGGFMGTFITGGYGGYPLDEEMTVKICSPNGDSDGNANTAECF